MAAAPRPFNSFHDVLKEAAQKVAKEVLGDRVYVHSEVRVLVKSISDRMLEEARTITNKEFKLVCSTTIQDASSGSGLVSHSSVFWDASNDGVVTSTFNSPHIVAVISIFGCAV